MMRKKFSTLAVLLAFALSMVVLHYSYNGGSTSSFAALTFLLSSANARPASFSPSTGNTKSVRKRGGITREKSRLEKMEEGLARSRASIRRAILFRNYTSRKRQSYIPRGSVYHNPYAFHQSYIEMEKRLKIWVYKEGEPPLVHDGPYSDIYSIEGQFINEMDQHGPLIANNAEEALVYFLPFSVTIMVRFVYKKRSYDMAPLQTIVRDYIQLISTLYTYWNRTKGADHFMLSCDDWAPYAARKDQDLFRNSIRVLCNANSSEGFNPKKDVPLPEFNIRNFELPAPIDNSSPPSSKTILAFFAGGNHGAIRHELLQQWKGKDSQVLVFHRLPKGQNYTELMLKSKYCLCPSGYEVASPRITEAILVGCVPVLISESYVLPFSDVLDWSQFSLSIPVSRIPEIKEILSAIPESIYLKLQSNVLKVQRHFVINRPPKRFDVMHMLFHSIWLRRLNVRLHDL
ncbi:probable glycosyltransferase At3g42180 isoform X2 [Nymphaea colorata]|uniref:probable glycosyltransferase At3g42180 isoform X2 n=1 Tax=Nymphaea colorata TaxID=210225 RepID=UPI00129DFC9F|nr:probable glycosyltransferase At3g42180 isoform X2 [Nymphaea colorata]